MDKIEAFGRRLAKIGIDVKMAMNAPWIYLTHINGERVTELFKGNHGFTIAFYPIHMNQRLQFTDIGEIFKLIRKYTGKKCDCDLSWRYWDKDGSKCLKCGKRHPK